MDNILDWACSFSGCDGGNINSDIWLCGIEWGGGSINNYYTKILPEQISKGKLETYPKFYDWTDSLSYPFGLSFAKLYTSISGGKVENYSLVKDLKGDELFKLNLYPIAFDSTNDNLWHQYSLDEITGFESKHLFNTWCFFNRSPFYSKLRKKHSPKLIICTGISYIRDFIMFFGGNDKIDKLNTGYLTPEESEFNNYIRQYYWLRLSSNTLLIIIPFFNGRFGLNSNVLLQNMGENIEQLINNKQP
jgi:hypothetical protein